MTQTNRNEPRKENSVLFALRELQALELERQATAAQEEEARRAAQAREAALREVALREAAAREAVLLAEEARLRVGVEAREAAATRAVQQVQGEVQQAQGEVALLRAARDALAAQLAAAEAQRPRRGRALTLVLLACAVTGLVGSGVGFRVAGARAPAAVMRAQVAQVAQVSMLPVLRCPEVPPPAPSPAGPLVSADPPSEAPRPPRPRPRRPPSALGQPTTAELLARCGDDPLCGIPAAPSRPAPR